eukprot:550078_1
MAAFLTGKYEICPNYDDYYADSKRILQKRLKQHMQLKEPQIRNAIRNTISEVKRLGYRGQSIPKYIASFINCPEIARLIQSWTGPIISDQYKEKFDDSSDDTGEIDANKFTKDAINWLDQSSYKVTGKYFFAEHLKVIKQHLIRFCNALDIPKHQRQKVLSYSCIHCVCQLLSIKMKFHRSKKQHLMRATTLRDSKEVHHQFKKLYPAFDLARLKETVKWNNKHDPTKKGGNRYRVNSKAFAQNLRIYAANLLKKERKALGVTRVPTVSTDDEETDSDNDTDDEQLLPVYFRRLYVKHAEAMDLDDGNSNSHEHVKKAKRKPRRVSKPPPKPTPPPKPRPKYRRSKPKTNRTCCCDHDTRDPVYVAVPVPVPVPVGCPDPMGYIDRYYPSFSRNRFGYRSQRGAGYMDRGAYVRDHPYRMPPPNHMTMPHPVSPAVPTRQHERVVHEPMMPQVPPPGFPDYVPHSFAVDSRSTGEESVSSSSPGTPFVFAPPNYNGAGYDPLNNSLYMPPIDVSNTSHYTHEPNQIPMDDYLATGEHEAESHPSIAAMQNREENVNAIDNIFNYK